MKRLDNETLSQLVDGEWHEIDSAAAVRELCSDKSAQDQWSRYHLIRDVIRNEPVQLETDLSARIRACIDDEPAYSNVTSIDLSGAGAGSAASIDTPATDTPATAAGLSGWRLGMSGAALAACVALATVVGLNVLNSSGSPVGSQTAQIASVAQNVPTLQTVAATDRTLAVPGNGNLQASRLAPVELVANRESSFWVTPEATRQASTEMRLNTFLTQHIEHSPTANHQGMLPYSRIVGYDELSTGEQ